VKIVKGFRSGVFLPQVATENNWDLETFMNELCLEKAGLPKDSWKGKEVDLYIFTAQVFGEE
jgi:AMMECR1 domain-containing protein